ncbi:conserved hypothetical protein [Desulfonatronospira thiodismutans ASO3-1]|uniref:Uncharacterized protein n=1 Tax=Desulfonatronospira thiodismutans ASO3-1 TaxID=555779 RepID=D6SPZ6_9BACT|nr:hypothetical protein [Desulfonatronospira thiodismutans]EFI34822.1 conserved hypothetical protein [Desulfonatronospira thiodismutans ASO3-1]
MTADKFQIGWSQRIRLEWLERTANLVLAGNDKDTVFASLQQDLQDQLSIGGTAKRGNREKVITILMKLWSVPPRHLQDFRNRGLNLLQVLPVKQHLLVHWGMATAVYPFWAGVAEQTGRLLRLQGHVAAAQVQRRIRERYGERETVSRAARRVLRSFMDWGVLEDSGKKGVYVQGRNLPVDTSESMGWLIEALLRAGSRDSASLHSLMHSPSLFPFSFSGSVSLNTYSGLEFMRFGMDEDMVMLSK